MAMIKIVLKGRTTKLKYSHISFLITYSPQIPHFYIRPVGTNEVQSEERLFLDDIQKYTSRA